MTGRAKSDQVAVSIVLLVMVVMVNVQFMRLIVGTSANSASESIALSDLVLQPLGELAAIGRNGGAIFPSTGLRPAVEFPRTSMTAEDLADNGGRSSDYLLAAIATRIDGLKSWAYSHFVFVLALVLGFALMSAERFWVSLNLRGFSLELLSAFGALNGRHAPAALGLRAGVAAARVWSGLQQVGLDQKRFPAVGARHLFKLRGTLVGTPASMVTEPPSGPNFLKVFTALSASRHSSIFSCSAHLDQYQRA